MCDYVRTVLFFDRFGVEYWFPLNAYLHRQRPDGQLESVTVAEAQVGERLIFYKHNDPSEKPVYVMRAP